MKAALRPARFHVFFSPKEVADKRGCVILLHVPLVYCSSGALFPSLHHTPIISQPPYRLLIRAITCVLHLPWLHWSAADSLAPPSTNHASLLPYERTVSNPV